jgi:hypothetical protein
VVSYVTMPRQPEAKPPTLKQPNLRKPWLLQVAYAGILVAVGLMGVYTGQSWSHWLLQFAALNAAATSVTLLLMWRSQRRKAARGSSGR